MACLFAANIYQWRENKTLRDLILKQNETFMSKYNEQADTNNTKYTDLLEKQINSSNAVAGIIERIRDSIERARQ